MADPTPAAGSPSRAVRRPPDRALLVVLATALLLLLVSVVIGLVATRNPTPPTLDLPTASSR